MLTQWPGGRSERRFEDEMSRVCAESEIWYKRFEAEKAENRRIEEGEKRQNSDGIRNG